MKIIRGAASLLLCFWFLPTFALDRLTLSTDSIQGADWRAEGLQWMLQLQGDADTQLKIRRLRLPPPYGDVESLRIHCPGLVMQAFLLECPQGRATGSAPWLGTTPFSVRFRYESGTRRLVLSIKDLPAFAGKLDLQASYADEWKVSLDVRAVKADQAGQWLPAITEFFQQWQFDGLFNATLLATARRMSFSFDSPGLNFSDADGRYASELFEWSVAGAMERIGSSWQGSITGNLKAGQIYTDPVFNDFSVHPARFEAGVVLHDSGVVELTEGWFEQEKVMQVKASGSLKEGQLEALHANVEKFQLDTGYEIYAKPFLLGTVLEALQTAGEADIDLSMTGLGIQTVKAELRSVVMEDTKGRFAWDGLSGEVHWNKKGEVPVSNLQWNGGAAYKLLFGPANLQLQLAAESLHLLKPLTMPLLEGALVINQFRADKLGAPGMSIQFDGELEPLNLEALTTALDWPRFGGQLAGRLPDLDYRDGVLTLGGALQAQVFDGEVRVENLRVQNPFGNLPQLFADMRLRNLNLEAVTQAFSFGRIEGRLDGDVEQLQMLNWRPVGFNARLRSPENDKSRHRISQRAIENISAIGGGGAGAVLSRGFLQFFDDFAYDRIGLSCRLSAGICQMGGLEPSKDGIGYVLVKGKLLPRIDVIGYASEVDWETLVEQLKSATKGQGPELR